MKAQKGSELGFVIRRVNSAIQWMVNFIALQKCSEQLKASEISDIIIGNFFNIKSLNLSATNK